MARSKVKRLPPDVREAIDGLLREDRHTLDELIAELQRRFPAVDLPSRSGLHRHQQDVQAMTQRIRDMQAAASAVVADLGENPDDKVGGLMVQAVTALCGHVAMRATASDEETSIKDALALARMAREASSARKATLAERQAIERAAEERLRKQQAQALESVVKTAGLTKETADAIRKQILGVAA